MMSDAIVSMYVTVESEDVAVHIATDLVKEKLVACANVQTGTRSIYEWNGLIQLDNEVTLIMKTTWELTDRVTEKILELHNYHNPCVVVHPIIGGNQKYIDWVKGQCLSE